MHNCWNNYYVYPIVLIIFTSDVLKKIESTRLLIHMTEAKLRASVRKIFRRSEQDKSLDNAQLITSVKFDNNIFLFASVCHNSCVRSPLKIPHNILWLFPMSGQGREGGRRGRGKVWCADIWFDKDFRPFASGREIDVVVNGVWLSSKVTRK